MATNILLIVLLLSNLFSLTQCFVHSTTNTVSSLASRLHHVRSQQPQSQSTQQLHGVLPQWLDVFNGFPSALTTATDAIEKENGVDPDYPWLFTGRLWFRPSIVRIPPPSSSSSSNNQTPSKKTPPPIPPSIYPLHIFGYTIGGTVVLEYDESPVGPYREYVTMGSLVYSKERGFALGQWGSELYVSTQEAVDVCRTTWGVPALLADIGLVGDVSSASSSLSEKLSVETAPNDTNKNQQGGVPKIVVEGWGNTRVLGNNSGNIDNKRYGGLPVLWTPSIKALWAPFVLFPRGVDDDGDVDDDNDQGALPLHRLRLSASAVRLKFCNQAPSDALGVPIGIGLVVDDVLIEIARQDGVI